MDNRRAEIEACIEPCDTGDGVVLLTDMFGGTPSNLAISMMEQQGVEVIAGVNLPMLVKLAKVRSNQPLADAVNCAEEAGRKYIAAASHVLHWLQGPTATADDAARTATLLAQSHHPSASPPVLTPHRHQCQQARPARPRRRQVRHAGRAFRRLGGRDPRRADRCPARSIMGLMMLGAGMGAIIELRAEGWDAKEALDALAALVEAGFDEQG